jgi:hypothetical protein
MSALDELRHAVARLQVEVDELKFEAKATRFVVLGVIVYAAVRLWDRFF